MAVGTNWTNGWNFLDYAIINNSEGTTIFLGTTLKLHFMLVAFHLKPRFIVIVNNLYDFIVVICKLDKHSYKWIEPEARFSLSRALS